MCVGERMSINITNLKTWFTITSAISKVIRHMIAGLEPSEHQDLKATATIARSMDIEPLNANKILCGHQINLQRPKSMEITTIGTTILGRVVTTIKNMDKSLRIA